LAAGNGYGPSDELEREKRQLGERLKDSDQASGDGGDGSRFGDQKPGPGVEKSWQRAVSITKVNVLASGLGLHCAQLGIGESAKKRQRAADNPREVDKLGGADGLHHFGRYQKNAAADNRPHHHSARLADTEVAGEARYGGGFLAGRLQA